MTPEACQPSRELSTHARRLVVAAIALWLLAMGYGLLGMVRYEYKSEGDLQSPPEIWPAESRLPHRHGASQLVVFVHPRCPCTRGTVSELERLLLSPTLHRPGNLQLTVVAATPPEADAAWSEAPIVDRFRRLPYSQVVMDPAGREATLFGAVSSGTVFYFDERDQRQYAGGITMARGHEGRNAGSAAIERLLAGLAVEGDSLPALGCRLPHDPGSDETPVAPPVDSVQLEGLVR